MYTSIAQRTQTLTLHSLGVKASEIEAITGMKKKCIEGPLTQGSETGLCTRRPHQG
ncbi:uncharacterized protein P884DRAFT_23925 [Thermothelomyces heterothallicus CBS 202.75]|uniref:uncharacterized protein n=1 Tax=Thermothelomyces heterothallicus CBS 202.75 TaxID=1149848 RepID=UPI00374434BF